MNRHIKKVAVLGSGVMGSRIACHFANIGVQVLLLDIAPKELSEEEKKKNLTLEDKAVRNRIVNQSLEAAIKSKPAPLYKKEFANRITTGNFEDNMQDIADCDWILEAVIEKLDIKKSVFEQIEKYRQEGTLITTNTSGIPINMMLEGRSEDFQKHFCGTHFFNPPRYLQLLEIIPTKKTDKTIVEFLMYYGDRFLGKTTVLAKNTPAFIANRVGVYAIMSIFHLMKELGLSVEEVDVLTGPVIGRPKSATFRTCDVVGIDTLVKVANDLYQNCPDDEQREKFQVPQFINKMVEKGWTGEKSGQGFYKKEKDGGSKSEIYAIDTETLEYHSKKKTKFASLEAAKPVESLKERIKMLVGGSNVPKDKAVEFLQKFHYDLFAYVSHRVPEVADELYKIDDGIKAGFGWEIGAFETWDIVGVQKIVEAMETAGRKPAPWVYEMLESGSNSFYKIEEGQRKYYDVQSKSYKLIPGTDDIIVLSNYKTKDKIIWQNKGATLLNIGDGILNLEFHSKMNTMGSEVLEGINKAIDIAEQDYAGLVIANNGQNFSAGANLGMIFMLAVEQEWDELDFAIRYFQNTMMRARYSDIPVVVAPHNMALGGGCELTLHADQVQASAETYIGLVELGVGVIPAGGGTKEMAMRAADRYFKGDVELNTLQEYFLTIGQAKVATSAYEAFDLGLLKKGRDKISINPNRRIADAKKAALQLAEAGYTQPIRRSDIKVLGKTALGMFLTGAHAYYAAGYISEHDKKLSEKLAWVMSGGDLDGANYVSEQYLLDLEKEAFLSLCGEKKTLQRMESILKTGKPLRN